MNILIVTDTFPPERVGSYRMNDLAANLSRDGFKVTVICPPPTFPFGSFKRTWRPVTVDNTAANVQIVHLWTWQPQSVNVSTISRLAYYLIMPLLAVFWMIFKRDYDVVIGSTGSSPVVWLPGLLAKQFRKKLFVVDVRDLPSDSAVSLGFLEKGSLFTRFLKLFEHACYHRSDFVTAPTESVRKGVLSCGLPACKVSLIPNAADIDLFYPHSVPKKRQIVYAGNIGYAQDFDSVLSAMQYLSKSGIKLLMIGEGEVKAHLQKKVAANKLDNSIIFLGGLDRKELPSILSESIAGLAPLKNLSIIEGSIPAKVFDYMACAIPFIAFGGSDLKDIASRSGSGFVIKNDAKLLAETVLSLVQNPEMSSQMGAKGREFCERFYNRRAMAKQIESKLYSLGKGKNACDRIK
jgi:colanic acid biosynthesis glycosyl transferase WcaI